VIEGSDLAFSWAQADGERALHENRLPAGYMLLIRNAFALEIGWTPWIYEPSHNWAGGR